MRLFTLWKKIMISAKESIRFRIKQDYDNELRYLRDAKVSLSIEQKDVNSRIERVAEYERIMNLCYGAE